MSMLVFYIYRAGGILPTNRKEVLEDAKEELRKEFGKRRWDRSCALIAIIARSARLSENRFSRNIKYRNSSRREWLA